MVRTKEEKLGYSPWIKLLASLQADEVLSLVCMGICPSFKGYNPLFTWEKERSLSLRLSNLSQKMRAEKSMFFKIKGKIMSQWVDRAANVRPLQQACLVNCKVCAWVCVCMCADAKIFFTPYTVLVEIRIHKHTYVKSLILKTLILNVFLLLTLFIGCVSGLFYLQWPCSQYGW